MIWLKEFRLKKGLSRLQMAENLGVSKSLYEKVEMGFKTPSINFITRFKIEYPETDTNLFFSDLLHKKC